MDSSDETRGDHDIEFFTSSFLGMSQLAELLGFAGRTFGVKIGSTEKFAYEMKSISEIAEFVYLRRQGQL